MTPKKRAIVDASFIRSCPENGSAVRALVDQGYHLVLTDYLVYELCSSGDPKRWSDAANKLAPFSDEIECWHHSAKMLRTECETKQPVEEIRDDQITNLLRKQLKKDPSYLPEDILQLVGYHGQQRERDTPSAAFRSFTALRPMATSLENAISNKGLKECTPGCAAFVQNRQNVDKIIDMVGILFVLGQSMRSAQVGLVHRCANRHVGKLIAKSDFTHQDRGDLVQEVSNEFNESCQTIRQALPRESRFVANISHQHYLVTSDNEGNFEVESVDTV